MSTATATKTPRTLITSGSISATTFTRGGLDCRTIMGGIITMKVTNGSSAPTTAPTMKVMIAHDSGTLPATGAAGSVWKTVYSAAGDTVASSVTERSYELPMGALHVQVEIGGQATNAVTGEAFMGETSSISNV